MIRINKENDSGRKLFGEQQDGKEMFITEVGVSCCFFFAHAVQLATLS